MLLIVFVRLHCMHALHICGYCYTCSVPCLLATTVSCAATAEPIEMPFGEWTRAGQRKHVLGLARSQRKRAILGHRLTYNNNDHLTAFDPGQPGTRRNIHPLTPIRIIVFPLSPYSICNGPWHPLYSTYVLDSLNVQPLSRSSLLFPLVLNPQLHAPYISSPSHRHLFATHDRTSAACSAAIPMLCHLPLVSLSAPYLGDDTDNRHRCSACD